MKNGGSRSTNKKAIAPPRVWSYLPFIGSAVEMGQDIHGFIVKHSQRLNDTPIFSATIAGNHCYFLADVDLVLSLPYQSIKNKANGLDATVFGEMFAVRVLSVEPQKAHALFYQSDLLEGAYKQFHHFLFDRKQLEQSVPRMQTALNVVINEIQQAITMSNATPPSSSESSSVLLCSTIPLYEFITNAIFRASVDPLISKAIATNEMAKLFRTFEHGIPFLFSGAPTFLLKKAVQARETMIHQHMGTTTEAYMEGLGPLIQARRDMLPWDDTMHCRSELGIIFAAVGNSIPAVFWTLLHVLKDPEAMEAIQNEVATILPDQSNGTVYSLEQLDKMEVIHAIFLEALRLYHAAFTVRMVMNDDCTVSVGTTTYKLQKGSRVMSFSQFVHHHPTIFPNPKQFVWNRFLRDPNTGMMPKFQLPNNNNNNSRQRILRSTPPLRFFGNGAHACPGRRFIAYEAKAFLAFLFRRFEMRLPSDYEHPGIDKTMDGIGVSHPNREVLIEIRPSSLLSSS